MPTETMPELQVRIKHAAFEAVYLEMTLPDPASHHFARLVAEHEARPRQEQGPEEGRLVLSEVMRDRLHPFRGCVGAPQCGLRPRDEGGRATQQGGEHGEERRRQQRT